MVRKIVGAALAGASLFTLVGGCSSAPGEQTSSQDDSLMFTHPAPPPPHACSATPQGFDPDDDEAAFLQAAGCRTYGVYVGPCMWNYALCSTSATGAVRNPVNAAIAYGNVVNTWVDFHGTHTCSQTMPWFAMTRDFVWDTCLSEPPAGYTYVFWQSTLNACMTRSTQYHINDPVTICPGGCMAPTPPT